MNCHDLAMHVAGGGEGVVNRAVLAQVQVKEVDASLDFVGDDPQFVGDLDELRGTVLASGDDVDFGLVVVKIEELPGSLQILEQAGGEGSGEQLGRPR